VTVPELRTERLLLRGFRADDIDAWAAIAGDPEVMRWLDREPLTRDGAWREMAMYVGHWELRGYGLWAVEELASGELAGRVGLWEPEGWPHTELAWTIGRPHQRRGYATEAARAAAVWAFGELGLDRLISLVADDNAASEGVARRLGARQDGRATIAGGHDLRVFRLDAGAL
jgi:RimJ/RimL family protein N-acetyltransferase